MPKFSVKKPFTVLVGVILVLVLGAVSLWNMPTDLLPSISLPYLIVVTAYPGASPERVENDVTRPLEAALGTVTGVENVSSTSSENVSMVMLEFADDTDMDSAMVKASTAINQLGDSLPDTVTTPTIIEMSPDMLATEYVAVDCEGMDIYQLSEFAEETVIPAIERVAGVANVTPTGLVERTVEVTLQQDKIDRVNDRLLRTVSERLDEAAEELERSEKQMNDGLAELDKAEEQMNSGKNELDTQQSNIADMVRGAIETLDNETIPALEQRIGELEGQIETLQQKIEEAKIEQGSLPSVDIPDVHIGDLGIDDAMLANAKAIIRTYRPDADLSGLPNDLNDAVYGRPLSRPAMITAISDTLPAIDTAMDDWAAALADALGDPQYADMNAEQANAALQQAETQLVVDIASLQLQIDEREQLVAELAAYQNELQSNPDAVPPAELEEYLPVPDHLPGLQEELDGWRQDLENANRNLEKVQEQQQLYQKMQSDKTTLNATSLALQNANLLLKTAEDARTAAEQAANAQATQLESQLNARIRSLEEQLTGLNKYLDQAKGMLAKLNEQRANLQGTLQGLEANPLDPTLGDMASQLLFSGMQAQLQLGQFQLESGRAQMEAGQAQLDAAREQYESAREEALKNANLDQLLNIQTLTQLIGAQNFSMPAGYIDSGRGDGVTYLLKIGEPYESVEELSNTLLVNMEGLGPVRLKDVADVVLTDNAGDSYAKMGGNQAVLLALYKGSTASTSEVSDAANAAMQELETLHPGLHITPIMDQGDYIRLIVNSVMSNLLWGAALAIVVLALFLKDLRPTMVVAISIPLSVLFAVVLMYFSGITLNMISLSGLALGIGMLVDNSIVVIENIYRLRARGVPAARAAVQGARQVAGAIIASTLTTVCVFVPIVFTEGLTRQLMMDMALTIGYSLGASLIVALTVVPCAGSTLLRKARDIPHPWFDRVTAGYEKVLRFCLKVKAVPLALAIVLLAFSVWRVLNMGLVLIPEISSNQISVNVTMPEGNDKDTSVATADAVMERILSVPGIESVGAMSSAAAGSIMGGLGGGGEDDFSAFIYYIILDEESDNDQAGMQQAIRDATADLPCEVRVGSGSAMDISALTGSGVQVNIYGNDLDTLMEVIDRVTAIMEEIPGITEISNGQEEADTEVRVIVNKDRAMELGLTVAQVFAELSAALTTETTSTTLTVGADTYTVDIIDTTKTPDLETIFSHEFTTTTTDENGNQVQETHTLGEFANRFDAPGVNSIARENQSRYLSVTSATEAGYNTSLLARELGDRLDGLELPEGCTVELAGESTQIDEMLVQMAGMLALAFVMIYLVMVAQFQSLLSPFIVLFTVPLAFTGGMIALLISGEELSLMSLMGFLVLMGVIVNNGIVFVDYTNQLRVGGLDRTTALVATGTTRMRPILMTTLTTVLAMVTMLFSSDPGSEMGRGMAIVIVGGLLYATLMTLFIVPVIYDMLFKKQPVNVDVGDDGMDDLPDDAAEFAARYGAVPAAVTAAAEAPDGEYAALPQGDGKEQPYGDDFAGKVDATPAEEADFTVELPKQGGDK